MVDRHRHRRRAARARPRGADDRPRAADALPAGPVRHRADPALAQGLAQVFDRERPAAKAIIEAIITAPPPGRRRGIVLYYGGRRRADLYDLAYLHEMELAYPWLQVIPATSDERARDAVPGTVPELAARAKVTDREIYISGPDAMIVSAARVVMGRGAPARLIRYDLSR